MRDLRKDLMVFGPVTLVLAFFAGCLTQVGFAAWDRDRLAAENRELRSRWTAAAAELDAVRRDRPDPANGETIPPPGVPER